MNREYAQYIIIINNKNIIVVINKIISYIFSLQLI